MPIGSLPAFQRALLKRHVQSRGRGQMTRTSDISGKIAGDLFRRQLAYRDIALGRKARMEGARQFGERLDLQKKKIRTAEKELPIRTGLGLATSGFAALQGMERRNILQKQAEKQRLQNWKINDFMSRQYAPTPGMLPNEENR